MYRYVHVCVSCSQGRRYSATIVSPRTVTCARPPVSRRAHEPTMPVAASCSYTLCVSASTYILHRTQSLLNHSLCLDVKPERATFLKKNAQIQPNTRPMTSLRA